MPPIHETAFPSTAGAAAGATNVDNLGAERAYKTPQRALSFSLQKSGESAEPIVESTTVHKQQV